MDSSIEKINQDLHEATRELRIKEALLTEYLCEIENFRANEATQRKKWESKVADLEEQMRLSRAQHSENQEMFEAELTRKEAEIDNLKKDLEVMKKIVPTENLLDISNSQSEEFQFLKDENTFMQEALGELKEKLEVTEQRNREFEQIVDNYKDEINQLRETLTIKREELSEKEAVNEKLTDELECLKQELIALKQKPLDQESKGNSLFAEVDDRRVHLQQTVTNMKSEYIRLKQEVTQHQKLISSLRKQNAELCDKWKRDVEEIEEDRLMIKKTYKDRISQLEQLVEKLQKDLEVKPHNVSDNLHAEYVFYTNMIKRKEKENRELEREINKNSLYEQGLVMDLAHARKEARKWHNEAIKLAQDKDRVTVVANRDSDNFKVPLPVSKATPTVPLKSCIKSDEKVDEPEEVNLKNEDNELECEISTAKKGVTFGERRKGSRVFSTTAMVKKEC